MNTIGALHKRWLSTRRCRILAEWMAALIPAEARTVADVGCGDGMMMKQVKARRPELEFTGFEVLLRPERQTNIRQFDGEKLPVADQSFDVVMFVDVLHHTLEPSVLLREAQRVSRQAIVIKDHCREGILAATTLRFMDWVGNAHHGVALPYNYWTAERWRQAVAELGWVEQRRQTRLGLYSWPASLCFERRLHFAACYSRL